MSRERKTGGLSVAATIPPGVPNATSFGPGPSIVQVCPSCACRIPRGILVKKVKFYSRSRKKVTVLNLFYKGAVNAYFLTGSFFKKTVVFEAAIFVGQSEDGAEVRCEVSRRVETAVSIYSGPSGLRFMVCSARRNPTAVQLYL